jgi:cytochrome c biogenesis protein
VTLILKGFVNAIGHIYQFFCSTKLALILILANGAFNLLGALIPTIDVFHSWWFLGAGALLMLNILICTLNRWNYIKTTFRKGPISQEMDFYSSGNANHSEICIIHPSQTEALELTQSILSKHGYRNRVEKDSHNTYISADKHRYFRLGSIVSHFSLTLIILAYVLGNYYGFRDTEFTVVEGDTREIGHNTDLAIKLVSFTDEYYPDNTPKDYRSETTLYEKGQIVNQSVIRVNQPLDYKGIRVYQSFFGPAIELQIKRNGTIIYQGNIKMDRISESQGLRRYSGSITLPATQLNVRIISSAINSKDQMIPSGQIAFDVKQDNTQAGLKLLRKGSTEKVNDFELEYLSDKQFSGFQVSYDPANLLIWIASSLFILGIIAVFYLPHRQVWILYQSQLAGDSRVLIRLRGSRSSNTNRELATLVNDIRRELNK